MTGNGGSRYGLTWGQDGGIDRLSCRQPSARARRGREIYGRDVRSARWSTCRGILVHLIGKRPKAQAVGREVNTFRPFEPEPIVGDERYLARSTFQHRVADRAVDFVGKSVARDWPLASRNVG